MNTRELKRIYLAGRVTGININSVRYKFRTASVFLRSQGFDEVINPMDIIPNGTEWTLAMLKLLPYLATCNYIAMLPGWEQSIGARCEYEFALGMEREGIMRAIIHLDFTEVYETEVSERRVLKQNSDAKLLRHAMKVFQQAV